MPPFLSVVMRTQGRRPVLLREALNCLNEQKVIDFELLLMVYQAEKYDQDRVEKILAELPEAFMAKTRLFHVTANERPAAFNHGFASALGDYIAAVEDDQFLVPTWVQVFKELAGRARGKIFRAVAVDQEVEEVEGEEGYRIIGDVQKNYPANFSFIQHMLRNLTPLCALAFPRALYHEKGLRFDETFTASEDWDFLIRAAQVCPIACSSETTSINRKWVNAQAMSGAARGEEISRNEARVAAKLNIAQIILPVNSQKDLKDFKRQLLANATDAGMRQRMAEEFRVRLEAVSEKVNAAQSEAEALKAQVTSLSNEKKELEVELSKWQRAVETLSETVEKQEKELNTKSVKAVQKITHLFKGGADKSEDKP